jgi:hypothetical protein
MKKLIAIVALTTLTFGLRAAETTKPACPKKPDCCCCGKSGCDKAGKDAKVQSPKAAEQVRK